MMQTLYSSIHHEMIGPLKNNVNLIEQLMRLLDNINTKKLAQMIMISSKLVLLQANDLMDMQFLQRGKFRPAMGTGKISNVI